jgi:hypothetical protein
MCFSKKAVVKRDERCTMMHFIICTLHLYIYKKMGRIYSTDGIKKKVVTAFWLGIIEGTDHLRE